MRKELYEPTTGRRMESGDIYEALCTIYENSNVENLISDICNHFDVDDLEYFLGATADEDNEFGTYTN